MGAVTAVQLRRGTAAAWTSANPTLSAGEVGFESDTGKFKVGDGSTVWASLGYAAHRPGGTDVPVADGGTGASTAGAARKNLDALLRVGRLIISGHSWNYEPNPPYGASDPMANVPRNQASYPTILRDALLDGTDGRYMEVPVPAVAAGTTTTTLLGIIPEDCVIEGVWYVPVGALTGANTNTRKVEAQVRYLLSWQAFGVRQFDSGVNLAKGVPLAIYNLLMGDTTALARSTATALLLFPPWTPSLGFWNAGSVGTPTTLMWVSTAVGTGLADPGGTVVVRLGGRYRNFGQGGARLLRAGQYQGGWGAQLMVHPAPRMLGVEVIPTVTAAAAAPSLTVMSIAAPRASGNVVAVNNRVTATLTAAAVTGATSITVSALSGEVPAGSHGFATGAAGYADGYQHEGVHVMQWGIVDAIGTQDRVAWRETMRAVIAAASCPFLTTGWGGSSTGNVQFTAGNGAGATWADYGNIAAGQWGMVGRFASNAAPGKRFTGAVGGTPPTITLKIAPAFPGGALDLFFSALAGTSRGAQASISVDGGAAIIVDTSSASPSALQVETASCTTATSTTLTTSGTFYDWWVGRVVEKADIPKGTVVASIQSATSLTLSVAATGSTTGTATFVGHTPMVKRLTGLAAGAHSVVITLTGIDATDASAALIWIGYGFEVATPVMWCNIAKTPGGYYDTASDDLNTDSLAVIAGTAAAVGTSTQEPALPSLVRYVDVDSALGASQALFQNLIHPNSAGHQVIAALLMREISTLTLEQAMSR